ncbi:MAG TPA: hypothetical protein VFE47_27150 [Tepidisphaeraceae bacterium]|nr:hypothetical protein [Tepidisphaeraceae bacterium]
MLFHRSKFTVNAPACLAVARTTMRRAIATAKRAGLFALLIAILAISRGFAVDVLPAPAPPRPPSMETISAAQVAAIEGELAMLLQHRLDAAGPELTLIDFQIDMRVMQRWLLARAAEDKTPVELQACIALRVTNLKSAGDQISQRLQSSAKALSPAQLDGLAKLHQLTYKLPAIKKSGEIDAVLKSVATDLILASNATPAEVQNLPPMRPQPFADGSKTPIAAPKTLAQLDARAKELQVSPALKRQLAGLAAAADTAAADPKAAADAAALFDTLSTAVDLSDAMEKNIGIDPAARPKMEQQLTEGLALFTDPRTRSAGLGRIGALRQYRDSVQRIGRLRIPPALQQKLGAAFVFANNNPDAGPGILAAIETYLQLCNRCDSRKEAALVPNQKRIVDTLQKQFAAQRVGFLDDASALGAATQFLSSTPASLAAHIDTMTQLLDSIEAIEKLPHAIQTLQAYRLKPTGGLEKRTGTAVLELGATGQLGSHDAALRLLGDVEHLAQLSESLGMPAGISPITLKLYTHDRMPNIDSRRTLLVSSLASQLAAGHDMDSADLSKLQMLHDMLDSLHLANDVENGLAKSELLTRWADWSITPAQLKALVAPYREGTAAAFDGFADDNATPLFRWPDLYKRFLPILVLTKQAGLYADQCTEFPTGLPGDFARLLTPMENQPFATERFASLAVTVWQASATLGDPKITDAVFDAMLARLRKELRLE